MPHGHGPDYRQGRASEGNQSSGRPGPMRYNPIRASPQKPKPIYMLGIEHGKKSSSKDDDDEDFKSLLDDYKSIQEKLAALDNDKESATDNVKTEHGDTQSDGIVEQKDTSEVLKKKEEDNVIKAGSEGNDEDDDMDLLELRRLALESTLKKERQAESAEASTSKESNEIRGSDRQRKKSSPGKRASQSSSRERLPDRRASSNDRHSDSHSNRRQRSPPSGTWSRVSPTKLRNRQIERERRRRESERQKESAERRRRQSDDDRKKRQAEEEKRREINRILTINDPKEQVERFLRMLESSSPAKPNSSTKSSKSPSNTQKSSQSVRKQSVPLKDNYEEVEMDLDSENDSPALPLESTSGYSNMELDREVYPGYDPYTVNAMPQLSLWDMSVMDLGPSWLDTGIDPPLLQDPPVPPPPPPLPPESPLPPPPPESPPPLPKEPHPLDSVSDGTSLITHVKEEQVKEETSNKYQGMDILSEKIKTEEDGALNGSGNVSISSSVEDIKRQSSSTTSIFEDIEADEAEEARMRANLLRSIAAKRKQAELKQNIKKETSSGGNSPLSSRSISPMPSSVVPAQTVRGRQLVTNLSALPVHKPVVINLGDDSSDEDEESANQESAFNLLAGLDSFLKEARKSSEVRKSTEKREETVAKSESDTIAKQQQKQNRDMQIVQRKLEIKQVEDQLVKQRASIIKDEGAYKQLLMKAHKSKKMMEEAKENEEKLREQLSAAEKITAATKKQFDVVRKQARKLRDQLGTKKDIFEKMKEKTLTAGKEVFGERYNIAPLSREVSTIGKKKVQNLSVTVVNERAIDNQSSKKLLDSPRKSASDIAQEKIKLQKQAEEVARKLKQLKNSQLKRKIGKENKTPATAAVQPIPRLEKIEIDTNDAEDETVKEKNEEKPSKRRRSLLDINPSTKPDLGENVAESQNQNNSSTNLNSAAKPDKPVKLSFPSKVQVKKLKVLMDDSVNSFLTSSDSVILPLRQCPESPKSAFIPKLKTVSSISDLTQSRSSSPAPYHSNSKDNPSFVYRSPLLHFKSYRFSPYYRTKAKLTLSSKTYANKLNPRKVLCRFDLQGTCHDEKCTGQHQSHYEMSDNEILQDIISYHPALCGIAKETQKQYYPRIIGTYINNLTKQHQGRLSGDQLKLFLVHQVLEKSEHKSPFYLFQHKRKWRPTYEEKTMKEDLKIKGEKSDYAKIEWEKPVSVVQQDSIIEGQDTRYFLSDSTSIEDMESAVMDTPNDVGLWIKLAHRKLHDNQSNSSNTCLDHALNALARGLEQNKDSSELWQTFLHYYAKHPESTDLLEMCQKALDNTQSYQIWWQYLDACKSCKKKLAICDSIVQYLLHDHEMDFAHRSHCLLEMILYKVHLYCWTGRHNSTVKYLQGYELGTDHWPAICDAMDMESKSILWICYINVLKFKWLPQQLYDPASHNGRIVTKCKLLISWDVKTDQQPESVKTYIDLFWKAIDKYEEAADVCRKLLLADPTMTDIWLCVADLYSVCGDATACRQVFEDSLQANQYSAQLYHYAAVFELKEGESDKALELLENSIITYFDVEKTNSKQSDPNMLFCTLLEEDVPLSFTAPEFKPDVTAEVIQADCQYLWMNYCFLLELQGDTTQAVEAYETALSTLDTVDNLTKLWISYIQFVNRQLNDTTNPKLKILKTRKFVSLVNRCVSSIPTKFEVLYTPGSTWFNYNYVNTIIEHYMNCVPEDNRTTEYRRFSEMMPTNVNLLTKACQTYVIEEDYIQARSLCTAATMEQICNMAFWKM
ncbi:hypothetical protein FSP39_019720 [Pinctada imbricata]|uniref:Zinc finger C3H1 domain-containing protein n=1 Tax=Pinctada imbricata TaxID=66713 RepID=A0AA88YFU7_PINIB|nr:hypothetical protein FSP39_019720 [Pinctada imbricata]